MKIKTWTWTTWTLEIKKWKRNMKNGNDQLNWKINLKNENMKMKNTNDNEHGK